MPSLPPSLFSDWIQPGAVVAVVGLLLGAFRGLRTEFKEEIRSSEARQEKQMDELKQEIRANDARLREEIKANEARQEKQMGALREEIKANNARQEKQMDELKEASRSLEEKFDHAHERALCTSSQGCSCLGGKERLKNTVKFFLQGPTGLLQFIHLLLLPGVVGFDFLPQPGVVGFDLLL